MRFYEARGVRRLCRVFSHSKSTGSPSNAMHAATWRGTSAQRRALRCAGLSFRSSETFPAKSWSNLRFRPSMEMDLMMGSISKLARPLGPAAMKPCPDYNHGPFQFFQGLGARE